MTFTLQELATSILHSDGFNGFPRSMAPDVVRDALRDILDNALRQRIGIALLGRSAVSIDLGNGHTLDCTMHGARPFQLYAVVQEPQPKYRASYAVVLWFTNADSKAQAVRNYLRDKGDANSERYREFKKPAAHVVVPGGIALHV